MQTRLLERKQMSISAFEDVTGAVLGRSGNGTDRAYHISVYLRSFGSMSVLLLGSLNRDRDELHVTQVLYPEGFSPLRLTEADLPGSHNLHALSDVYSLTIETLQSHLGADVHVIGKRLVRTDEVTQTATSDLEIIHTLY